MQQETNARYTQQCNCRWQALRDKCHENRDGKSEGLGRLALVSGSDADNEEHNSEENCDGGNHHHKAGTKVS